MNYMIIDIGSNTVKYDVFFVKAGKIKNIAHNTRPVKLLKRIENGVLTREGFDLLCETLTFFSQEAKKERCDAVCVFATAAVRRLRDGQKTLDEVFARTGVRVRLLSGEEEAACSFAGMLLTLKRAPGRGVMLDMGGGSTELNFFENGVSLWLHSCPFGVVSAKMELDLGITMSEEEKERTKAYVRSFLPEKSLTFPKCAENAVMIGGTAKAVSRLAKIFMNVKNPERLSLGEFIALRDLLCRAGKEEQKTVKEVCPDRYDLMSAGLTAYSAIFETLKTKKIYICRGGIREGYLQLFCLKGACSNDV